MSFPGPVRSVTIDQLKSYQVSNRRYRNRRIGEFLKELHLTEGRNTGFKKILDAIRDNGSPLPEFETDNDRSYFITRIHVHEAFLQNEANDGAINGAINLSKNEHAILAAISANPHVSRSVLILTLGIGKGTIDRSMKMLKEKGILQRIGSNKTGYWQINIK